MATYRSPFGPPRGPVSPSPSSAIRACPSFVWWASILSFDSMMASLGGVGIQPVLGRAADVWSYGPSYAIAGAISALSLPFIALSRKENALADTIEVTEAPVEPQPA